MKVKMKRGDNWLFCYLFACSSCQGQCRFTLSDNDDMMRLELGPVA